MILSVDAEKALTKIQYQFIVKTKIWKPLSANSQLTRQRAPSVDFFLGLETMTDLVAMNIPGAYIVVFSPLVLWSWNTISH